MSHPLVAEFIVEGEAEPLMRQNVPAVPAVADRVTIARTDAEPRRFLVSAVDWTLAEMSFAAGVFGYSARITLRPE